jgi:hypothetical protein
MAEKREVLHLDDGTCVVEAEHDGIICENTFEEPADAHLFAAAGMMREKGQALLDAIRLNDSWAGTAVARREFAAALAAAEPPKETT